MDIKIKVKACKKAEIPNPYGNQASNSDQFYQIIKDFIESDSECISLLSGEPCDEKITHILVSRVRSCIERNGFTGIKALERNKFNNVYVVKEA